MRAAAETEREPVWLCEKCGEMVKHEFVQGDGIQLHCATSGRGPLMLLLHGFPEFWYQWSRQLRDFSQEYLVVAPDLRGYNLSSKPQQVEQYAIEHLVSDVLRLADHFSPNSRFTLVGHDWGGFIAWAFASEHPDRLRNLIIINAPHPYVFDRLLSSDQGQRTASQYIVKLRSQQAEAKLLANGCAALVGIVLDRGLKTGTFSQEDQAQYLKAWTQPGALTGALNYYRANRLGPLEDNDARDSITRSNAGTGAVPLLEVPTLVIWGEQDTALVPQNFR